jgi:hypothetical protein
MLSDKFSFSCFENYATEPSGAALVKVVAESFQDRGASIRVCNSDYEVFQRCSGRRATGGLIIMVIKPEDRQLLADFVNNLTKEQRSEMLYKLLKTLSTTKSILNEEEMEKFRDQLDGDLAKNAQGRTNAAWTASQR